MNLNLLWFLPAVIIYIVVWILAIINLKKYKDWVEYWFFCHYSLFILFSLFGVIIGLTNLIK